MENASLLALIKGEQLTIHQRGDAIQEFNKLQEDRSALLKVLKMLSNISEDVGRAGCTYNDTKFDSLSAAYGHNLLLEWIKDQIDPVISKMEN